MAAIEWIRFGIVIVLLVFGMSIFFLLQRGGPAHIIPHAEHESIVKVMGTIDIDPVSEDMGLTVRYVLPGRQIRVEGLFLHFGLPPFRIHRFSESSGPIQYGFQAPVTNVCFCCESLFRIGNMFIGSPAASQPPLTRLQIGRASCRERV